MSFKERREREKLKHGVRKLSRKGFRGYPVATVAYYGPDDRRATKVAVGIVMTEDGDADILQRWFAEDGDVRNDPRINAEILDFIKLHEARSVVMVDRIFGCPHEEGIDYPTGEKCPACPFWAVRDRFTGEITH
jgi:hypothetical protein